MTGRVELETLRSLGVEGLADEWNRHELVRPDGSALVVTANGSWMIDEMIAALTERVDSAAWS